MSRGTAAERVRARRGVAGSAFALAAATFAAGAVTAGANSSGAVYAGPKSTQLQHTNAVAPNDWLSLGWSVQINNPNHAAAPVDLQNITVTLPLSCTANGSLTTVSWALPNQSVTVPAGFHDWYPTNQNNTVASYQLHVRAPDLCGGAPMYRGGGDANGAAMAATVYSGDTTDQLLLQFHSGDIYTDKTKPSSNIDCSSSQNPGDGTCASAWTSNQTSNQTFAQPLSAEPRPTPSGGTGGSGGGSSGGGSSGGGSSGGGSSGGGSSGGSSGGGATPGQLPVIGGGSGSGSGAAQPGGSQGATATAPAQRTPGPKIIATAPPAGAPAPLIGNVLGPVPVLAPVVGDAIAKVGSAIPWNWFLVLAGIDLVLIVVVAIRRRAHRAAA